MKKIELLFDCIRAPYDIAIIIQTAAALDCKLYTSGNCIAFDSNKIMNKLISWKISKLPEITHYQNLTEAVIDLKQKGRYIVGTSGYADTSYYDADFKDKQPVIVFGNEMSGIPSSKLHLFDAIVKLPMNADMEFLTLPVAVPAIAYDLYRQFNK